MDKKEAGYLLDQYLGGFRTRDYSDLVKMVDSGPFIEEVLSPTGKEYQVEVDVVWDDQPNGSIRVLGAIDDGGFSAICPLSDDFIKDRP
jgi:hypothetical protein